jgi:hypothetical protein
LFDSSVAVDSVLDFDEGRRIQMGFFASKKFFGKQSRQAKIMCQSLCYLCHGQMSTAYKPAFLCTYIERVHTHEELELVGGVQCGEVT